ncbi:MAG: amidohydrolase family protein [Candidatus Bipolaricaulota bacterium]
MIIDSHIHYGDSVRMNIKTSDKDLLDEMEKNGISKVCCVHMDALIYDMKGGNEKTYELTRAHPDKVYGFCTVPSVRWGTEVIPYIKKCIDEYGMIGVKLYSVPYVGQDRVWISIDNPIFYPVFEEIEKLSVPILVHSSPVEVDRVARRFSKIPIIMAHSGNAPAMHGKWHTAVQVASEHDNVFLDMCGSTIDIDCVKHAFQAVGPTKMIYGSDWPLFRFEFAISRFKSLDLSKRAESLIFHKNAESLFNL